MASRGAWGRQVAKSVISRGVTKYRTRVAAISTLRAGTQRPREHSRWGERLWGLTIWWETGGSGRGHRFAPFEGFEPFPFYPGYSANFFDGQTLRNEGRIGEHGRLHAAPIVSQLVPATLSIRLRELPLR